MGSAVGATHFHLLVVVPGGQADRCPGLRSPLVLSDQDVLTLSSPANVMCAGQEYSAVTNPHTVGKLSNKYLELVFSGRNSYYGRVNSDYVRTRCTCILIVMRCIVIKQDWLDYSQFASWPMYTHNIHELVCDKGAVS